MSEPPILIAGEWDALWSWHHDEECRLANRGEYIEAQWHKERRAAILPFTSTGRRSMPQPETPQTAKKVIDG